MSLIMTGTKPVWTFYAISLAKSDFFFLKKGEAPKGCLRRDGCSAAAEVGWVYADRSIMQF